MHPCLPGRDTFCRIQFRQFSNSQPRKAYKRGSGAISWVVKLRRNQLSSDTRLFFASFHWATNKMRFHFLRFIAANNKVHLFFKLFNKRLEIILWSQPCSIQLETERFLRTFQEYFSILSHLEVTRSSILTHLARTDWNASGVTAKLGYLSGKWLYLTLLLKDWCLLSNRFLKVAFNQMNRVFLTPCFRDYSGCLFDEKY